MFDNFIIHAKAQQYEWSGECFLSVKSFYKGLAKYQVQQREYHVSDHNFLILNDCTRYTLTIDNRKLTESFCVFFSPLFVSQFVSEFIATDEQLLDFSWKRREGFKLIERNFPHRGPVSETLLQGRGNEVLTRSTLEREEFYQRLLTHIFLQNSGAIREADKLVFKKSSTREEIHRRMYYAKDFIDANYTQDLTLRKIAEVAMLSENHLLRNFFQIFRTSPFHYITRLKIAEAKRQIMDTEKSISEIATTLGYTSMTNFSHYFKSIIGTSPLQLRKKVMHRK